MGADGGAAPSTQRRRLQRRWALLCPQTAAAAADTGLPPGRLLPRPPAPLLATLASASPREPAAPSAEPQEKEDEAPPCTLEGRRFQSSRPAPVTPPRRGRSPARLPALRSARPHLWTGTLCGAGRRGGGSPPCGEGGTMRDGAPGSLTGGEGSAGGGRLCARLGPSPTPAHGPPEGSGRGAPWRRCPKSPTALKRQLQPSRFSPSPAKHLSGPRRHLRAPGAWRPRSCKRGT